MTPDWFYPFVGLLIVLWLIGSLVIWFVLLKRQVRQRTRQLEQAIAEQELVERLIHAAPHTPEALSSGLQELGEARDELRLRKVRVRFWHGALN